MPPTRPPLDKHPPSTMSPKPEGEPETDLKFEIRSWVISAVLTVLFGTIVVLILKYGS